MSLCSVDLPTWFQRRAPNSGGVPAELLRALVMRDRHETLPRDLKEHHFKSVSSLWNTFQNLSFNQGRYFRGQLEVCIVNTLLRFLLLVWHVNVK